MTPADLPPEPDPRLVELALRITDESPVDWESERDTAVDLSETLEYLRRIDRHLESMDEQGRVRSQPATAPAHRP